MVNSLCSTERLETSHHIDPYCPFLFFLISFLIRRFPTLLPCICGLTMEFPFLIVSCLWSLSFSLCLFCTGSI